MKRIQIHSAVIKSCIQIVPRYFPVDTELLRVDLLLPITCLLFKDTRLLGT